MRIRVNTTEIGDIVAAELGRRGFKLTGKYNYQLDLEGETVEMLFEIEG